MTETLSDFLLAHIAEDEAAAGPFRNDFGEVRPWSCDEIGGTVRNGPNPLGDSDDVIAAATTHLAGEHIARHDPARVLAECAARRAVIDAYRDALSRRDAYQADGARAVEDAEQATRRRSAAARCRGLEIAVELLAQPYSAHPDFDSSRLLD